MKQLVHVTTLKHHKVDVYFCKETKMFHYYQMRFGELYEIHPSEPLAFIRYVPEDDSFTIYEYKNTKQKAINVLKGVVATLGAAVTITAAFPKILSLIDYVAIKSKTLTTTASMVGSFTSDEEYYKLLKNQVEKNDSFSAEEKKRLIEGHINFLKDWGYLLDEAQKEFILYQAANMIVIENPDLTQRGVLGIYSNGKIEVWNRSDADTVIHEGDHGFSDHGVSEGAEFDTTVNLGLSMSEAINECVSSKYKGKNNTSYTFDQEITFILSQIVGRELLVEAYATRTTRTDKIIKEICKNCPDASVKEVINFFSYWDMIHLSEYNLTDEQIKELELKVWNLITKFYENKYGISYLDTAFYKTRYISPAQLNPKELPLNFLDNNFNIIESEYIKECIYSIPVELGNKKLENDDYKKYLAHVKSDFILANGIATQEEIYNSKDRGELVEILEKKYANNPEQKEKFELIKYYLKLQLPTGTEEATIAFADLSFEHVLATENDPKRIACCLKQMTEYADYLYRETYVNRITELLKQNKCSEILYYYECTNIYWKQTSKVPEPMEFYEEYDLCYDYLITSDSSNKILLVRVPAGKEPVHYYSTSLYREVKWYEVSEEQLSAFSKKFEPGEGKYYCTIIDDDFKFSGSVKVKDIDNEPEEKYTIRK